MLIVIELTIFDNNGTLPKVINLNTTSPVLDAITPSYLADHRKFIKKVFYIFRHRYLILAWNTGHSDSSMLISFEFAFLNKNASVIKVEAIPSHVVI